MISNDAEEKGTKSAAMRQTRIKILNNSEEIEKLMKTYTKDSKTYEKCVQYIRDNSLSYMNSRSFRKIKDLLRRSLLQSIRKRFIKNEDGPYETELASDSNVAYLVGYDKVYEFKYGKRSESHFTSFLRFFFTLQQNYTTSIEEDVKFQQTLSKAQGETKTNKVNFCDSKEKDEQEKKTSDDNIEDAKQLAKQDDTKKVIIIKEDESLEIPIKGETLETIKREWKCSKGLHKAEAQKIQFELGTVAEVNDNDYQYDLAKAAMEEQMGPEPKQKFKDLLREEKKITINEDNYANFFKDANEKWYKYSVIYLNALILFIQAIENCDQPMRLDIEKITEDPFNAENFDTFLLWYLLKFRKTPSKLKRIPVSIKKDVVCALWNELKGYETMENTFFTNEELQEIQRKQLGEYLIPTVQDATGQRIGQSANKFQVKFKDDTLKSNYYMTHNNTEIKKIKGSTVQYAKFLDLDEIFRSTRMLDRPPVSQTEVVLDMLKNLNSRTSSGHSQTIYKKQY